MASMINILGSLSAFIVRTEDGSVNWDSTLEAIQGQILRELEENGKSDGVIEGSLDSLYNAVPAGTGLPTPMVVQTVAASLAGGNIASQVEWAGKVSDYLSRSQRFVSKRGRSGGLFRVG